MGRRGGGHEGVAVGDVGDGGDFPAEGDAEADGLLGRETKIVQAPRKPVESLGVGLGGARHGAVVRVDVGFAEEDEHGAREGGFQVGGRNAGAAEAVGMGDFEIGEHVGAGVGGAVEVTHATERLHEIESELAKAYARWAELE